MPAPDLIQQQRQIVRTFRQAKQQHIQSLKEASDRLKRETENAESTKNHSLEQADALIKEFRSAFKNSEERVLEGNKNAWQGVQHTMKVPLISGVSVEQNPSQEIEKQIKRINQIRNELPKVQQRGLGGWGCLMISGAIAAFIGTIIVFIVGTPFMLLLGVQIDKSTDDNIALLSMIASFVGFIYWRYWTTTEKPRQKLKDVVIPLSQASAIAEGWYQVWPKQIDKTCETQIAAAKNIHQEAVGRATQVLQSKFQPVASMLNSYSANANLASPKWLDSTWQQITFSQSVTSASRLGELQLIHNKNNFQLPSLLHFPAQSSLILKSNTVAKRTASKFVQSFLMRLLVTIPPGKLRFTFIDPVGLGQNVAPFMHLADYDEQLVTSKAWTEPQHIEQRLADLTEHMENVIQKYLRNQFATIEEYNAQAGEVAEPYRVLAVFDFPANFSETAARRLVSIAQNGPRCGVYAIVLVDTEKPLPYGFNLADLEQNATVIAWDGQRWVWQDEDFKDCLLELDEPPPADLFNRIVTTVGEAAKSAGKVEVPFARIAPPPSEQWTGDTGSELRVALGPSGARKLQMLELGRGTAQHVLVAGKTGSGKSTLLHTLITNLALHYSPDQLQLYLIDFKKGVEFKTYVTHALPHARVIAIESEREFGLSVLQGLDAELKRRGDLFRAAGVDDLPTYRQKLSTPSPLSLAFWRRG